MRNFSYVSLMAALLGASEAFAGSYDQSFEGTWIGTINRIDMSVYNPVDPEEAARNLPPLEIAISVDGDAVQVLFSEDFRWRELKSGSFRIDTHKTNAVAYATDSWIAKDESAGWVETWNFTLTHKDDDTLYAYWTRVVNNYNLPALSDPNARFAMMGFGEFELSPPVSSAGRVTVSGPKRIEGACDQTLLTCEGVAFPRYQIHK